MRLLDYMSVEESPSRRTEDQSQIPGVIARTEAEEALRQTADRYRSLFEETRDGIIITERDGRIIDANPAACQLYGYSRNELLALDARQLYWDPAAREQFQQQVERDGYVRDYEVRMRRKDGDELYCLVTNSVRRSPQGAVLGYQGIARDITQQKQLQMQLQTYQHQLRSLSAELTLAEDRERRRIAIELHDQVSQNLAVAALRIEALRASTPAPEQSQLLDELASLVDQMDGDIRSLTFELSPPVLYELGLRAGLDWLAEQIEGQHGLPIQIKASPQQRLGEDLSSILFRCVRELLSNVVKHGQASSAEVSIQQSGSTLQVEVADNGKGFEVSDVELEGGGMRFGLFSIRERLDLIGGRFEIESKPGAGTRCTITCPVAIEGEQTR